MSRKRTEIDRLPKEVVVCSVYEMQEDGSMKLVAEYTVDDDEAFEAIDIIKGNSESMQDFFKNTCVLE